MVTRFMGYRAFLVAIFAILLAHTASATPLAGIQVDSEDEREEINARLEAWARPKVADTLTAIGSRILTESNIFTSQLAMANEILKVATLTNPDSLPAWTKRLELATATRDDLDESEALELEALSNIIRLDPGNIVARFRRLVGQVDLGPTAESRISDFETLLAPENISRLGEGVSSRMAFELALLQRRVGDMDAFASNLARAVELDPSFPLAVETAAGFFRMATDDLAAEVELMVAAVIANPFNRRLQNTIGQLLLNEGAYDGASRVLEMAVGLGDKRDAAMVPLLEDLALAQWGRGDLDIALRTLEQAIQSQTMRLINEIRMQNPLMDQLQVLRDSPPIQPQLAMVKAVMLFVGSNTKRANEFQIELESGFSTMRLFMEEGLKNAISEDQTEEVAALRNALGNLAADEAWARVWFSENLSTVAALVDEALEAEAITGQQKQVIEAWVALREKRYADARSGFEEAASDSSYATAGIAMLDAAQGRKQSAARGFMKVYQESSGTALGLWCRERLSRLIGAEIPPPEGASELNQIIKGIPNGVFRAVADPQGMLAINVEPQKNPIGPFDSLEIKITLRNLLDIPLGIGLQGPIRSTIAIVPEISVAATSIEQLSGQIFAIDRTFSIPARDEVDFNINFAASRLGLALNSIALQGASVRLRVVVNYQVVQDNVTIGPLGEQTVSIPIRMDGGYKSKNANGYLIELMQQSANPRSVEDLIAMGLLSQYYNLSLTWIEELRPNIRESLVQGFVKLPPHAKAWLLAQLPKNEDDLIRIIDLALATDNPAVYAILFFNWTLDPGAPSIVAGRASKDPLIRRMAELARENVLITEELKSRQFEIGEDEDDEFELPGG